MNLFKTGLMASVVLALGACTTTGTGAEQAVAVPAKGALETGIEAAGGEAALGKVKELFWTGMAKVTVDGKTTEHSTAVLVRPFDFYRVTTWAKGSEEKSSKTTQAEQGKAWDVNRVSWIPMEAAAAKVQNEQLGLYSLMLLTPLKADGATVNDQPAGADGARAVQTQRAGAPAAELAFDASGKLVRAGYAGTDPKTGATVTEVYKFSGEIVSNGVKWPKHITIERDGAAWYELEIVSFEALAETKVRPLAQAMQYETGGPPTIEDAG